MVCLSQIHPTLVAGIMVGDGSKSVDHGGATDQWRGIVDTFLTWVEDHRKNNS